MNLNIKENDWKWDAYCNKQMKSTGNVSNND